MPAARRHHRGRGGRQGEGPQGGDDSQDRRECPVHGDQSRGSQVGLIPPNSLPLHSHGRQCPVQDEALDTPLHTAARMGAVAVVDKLLDAQADVTIPNRRGLTPLQCARLERREVILGRLHEASLRIVAGRLIQAEQTEVARLMRELEDAKEERKRQRAGDADLRRNIAAHVANLETALAAARARADPEACRAAAKAAAASEEATLAGAAFRKALGRAVVAGDVAALERLLALTDDVATTASIELPLDELKLEPDLASLFLAAAAAGDSASIAPSTALENSLQGVADLQSANADSAAAVARAAGLGVPPVHLACGAGRLDALRLLIQVGAAVNSFAGGFLTPLHVAVARGHLQVAELLVSSGAAIEGRDGLGRSVIHIAAEVGDVSTVEALVGLGADLYVVDHDGRTALHYAAGAAQEGTARILLREQPALALLVSVLQETALHSLLAAVRLGRVAGGPEGDRNLLPLVELLLEYDADITLAATPPGGGQGWKANKCADELGLPLIAGAFRQEENRWTLGMKGRRHPVLRRRPRTAEASAAKRGAQGREERLRALRNAAEAAATRLQSIWRGHASRRDSVDLFAAWHAYLQQLEANARQERRERESASRLLQARLRSLLAWRERDAAAAAVGQAGGGWRARLKGLLLGVRVPQLRDLLDLGRARASDVAARVSRAMRRVSGATISPQDAEAILDWYRQGNPAAGTRSTSVEVAMAQWEDRAGGGRRRQALPPPPTDDETGLSAFPSLPIAATRNYEDDGGADVWTADEDALQEEEEAGDNDEGGGEDLGLSDSQSRGGGAGGGKEGRAVAAGYRPAASVLRAPAAAAGGGENSHQSGDASVEGQGDGEGGVEGEENSGYVDDQERPPGSSGSSRPSTAAALAAAAAGRMSAAEAAAAAAAAIEARDLDGLKALLDAVAGLVDMPLANSGARALHVCAERGLPEFLTMLAEARASMEARNAAGETPLRAALRCRSEAQPAVIKTLLDLHADPGARAADGRTALHAACASNQPAATRELSLARGANLELREFVEDPAVAAASRACADWAAEGDGPTAFLLACSVGDAESASAVAATSPLCAHAAGAAAESAAHLLARCATVRGQRLLDDGEQARAFCQLLLSLDCDCFTPDLGGETPIEAAEKEGRLELRTAMEEMFSAINRREILSRLALCKCAHCLHRVDRRMVAATEADDGEAVSGLLETAAAQALINTAVVREGASLLHGLARSATPERPSVFRVVLDFRFLDQAMLNSPSVPEGFTPLHAAVQDRNFFTVQEILTHLLNSPAANTPLAYYSAAAWLGATILQPSTAGDATVHLAARLGDDDVLCCLIQFLKESGQFNGLAGRNKDGWSPLASAAINLQLDCIRTLLGEAGEAMIHQRTEAGETPAHLVVAGRPESVSLRELEERMLPVLEELVVAGVDVLAVDAEGRTAAGIAAARGLTRVAEVLSAVEHPSARLFRAVENDDMESLDNGIMSLRAQGTLTACLEAKDRMGFSPLHRAAKKGSTAAAAALLDAGADVEGRSMAADGATALLLAASEGQENMARFLMRRGASPTARDRAGRAAFHHACAAGLAALLDDLLAAAAAGGPADAAGDAGAANEEAGLNEESVVGVDGAGMVPLHWACRFGRMDCVRALVAVRPDSLDISVLSLSAAAVALGRGGVASGWRLDAAVAATAAAAAGVEEGDTPLCVAVRAPEEEDAAEVATLLCDEGGHSQIDRALEIAQLLARLHVVATLEAIRTRLRAASTATARRAGRLAATAAAAAAAAAGVAGAAVAEEAAGPRIRPRLEDAQPSPDSRFAPDRLARARLAAEARSDAAARARRAAERRRAAALARRERARTLAAQRAVAEESARAAGVRPGRLSAAVHEAALGPLPPESAAVVAAGAGEGHGFDYKPSDPWGGGMGHYPDDVGRFYVTVRLEGLELVGGEALGPDPVFRDLFTLPVLQCTDLLLQVWQEGPDGEDILRGECSLDVTHFAYPPPAVPTDAAAAAAGRQRAASRNFVASTKLAARTTEEPVIGADDLPDAPRWLKLDIPRWQGRPEAAVEDRVETGALRVSLRFERVAPLQDSSAFIFAPSSSHASARRSPPRRLLAEPTILPARLDFGGGDDADYLAAAGYDPAAIRTALGMLEEARAVFARLLVRYPSSEVVDAVAEAGEDDEEVDAGLVERELEDMGYTEGEISSFMLEADPDALGRVSLSAFLSAAPAIFGGLTDPAPPAASTTAEPDDVGRYLNDYDDDTRQGRRDESCFGTSASPLAARSSGGAEENRGDDAVAVTAAKLYVAILEATGLEMEPGLPVEAGRNLVVRLRCGDSELVTCPAPAPSPQDDLSAAGMVRWDEEFLFDFVLPQPAAATFPPQYPTSDSATWDADNDSEPRTVTFVHHSIGTAAPANLQLEVWAWGEGFGLGPPGVPGPAGSVCIAVADLPAQELLRVSSPAPTDGDAAAVPERVGAAAGVGMPVRLRGPPERRDTAANVRRTDPRVHVQTAAWAGHLRLSVAVVPVGGGGGGYQYCPAGCGAGLPGAAMRLHLLVCPSALVPCMFARLGCGAVLERRSASTHTAICPYAGIAAGLRAASEDVAALRRLAAAGLADALAASSAAVAAASVVPPSLGAASVGQAEVTPRSALPYPPTAVSQARARLAVAAAEASRGADRLELMSTGPLSLCASLGGGSVSSPGRETGEASASMMGHIGLSESPTRGGATQTSAAAAAAEVSFVLTASLPALRRPERGNQPALALVQESHGPKPAEAPCLTTVGSDEGSLCLWKLFDQGRRAELVHTTPRVKGGLACLHTSASVGGKVFAGGVFPRDLVSVWSVDGVAGAMELVEVAAWGSVGSQMEIGSLLLIEGRKLMAGDDNGNITKWDVDSGTSELRLRGHSLGVRALAAAGPHAVLSGSLDMKVLLWDVRTAGDPAVTLEGQCDSVTALWAHDASGAGGGGVGGRGWEVWSAGPASLRLWDLRAARLLRSLDGAAPLAAVPSAGGGSSVVVCADPDCRQRLLLWSSPGGAAGSGAWEVRGRLEAGTSSVAALAVWHDVLYTMTAEGQAVKIWART